MGMSYKHIEYEKADAVATITLNRPPLNIMNMEMLEELCQALSTTRREQPRLLVLRAKGTAFSAGIDVADHVPEKAQRMISLFHRMFHILNHTMTPTVAAVRGECLGAGCQLATFCDVVIASENATFGQPEIQIGLMAPVAAAFFPKLVGCRKTLELLLTGARISAREAAGIGLINRAVPDDQFEGEIAEVIKTISSLSAPVVRLNKKAVVEGLELDFEMALGNVEDIYLQELMKTNDTKEGIAAYLGRRRPKWCEK